MVAKKRARALVSAGSYRSIPLLTDILLRPPQSMPYLATPALG
jgi:hypothetical protein